MSAANWDAGQGLTWSCKWHVIDQSYIAPLMSLDRDARRALCGAFIYTRDHVPKYHAKMVAIANGTRTADVCKRCAKAATKR